MGVLSGCSRNHDYAKLKKLPASQLDCSQLKFMAKKYESICDSARKLAESGTSPAAAASTMTAMQACNRAGECYSEMARRCP